MAKVSVELGLTLKMATGGGFNFFRPSICISDIDIDGDIKDQIDRAVKAIEISWDDLGEAMGKVITQSEVTENESLLVELGRRMTDMEKQMKSLASGKDKEEKW